MRVLSSWAALGLAAVLFIACSSNSQKTESTPQPPTAAQPTSSAAPGSVVPTAASTGQSAPANPKQIGDLLLTVDGASLYTDNGFPAAPGTHYVAVDVTAKNTGDKTYILNVLNFRLTDSDGSLHDPAMTNGPEPLIGSYDSVDSGQVERGFVVFPLADGRDPVELQYQSPTGSIGSLPVPKPSS